MPINRRSVFARLIAAAGVLATPVVAKAAIADAGPPKVVYHLADVDKAGFVLGNIDNHIKGMGGPDKVKIVLVIHGPPLALFTVAKAQIDVSRHVERLSKAGLAFVACGNTMAAQQLALADLLPGFERADEGGVVRLAQLQAQGYAYLRP